MNNIPTAEQMQLKYLDDFKSSDITGMMIEFAKLHVQAALKEAAEKYRFDELNESDSPAYLEQTILNSYPLTNIK